MRPMKIISIIVLNLLYVSILGAQMPGHFRVPDINIDRTEKMIDVGGRALHCYQYGNGAPSTILVSGFGGPQTTWNAVVLGLADECTIITYDRAGYGKSEIGDLPTHAKQSAIDLFNLLDKLDLPGPYILVGHSYGVRVVRIFASLYPEKLAGLVLMEGQHPGILEAQKKALTGADKERLEMMSSRMRPPDNPKTEQDYMMVSYEQGKNIGPLPLIPCTVITAGANRERGIPPGFSDEGREKLIQVGIEMQKKMVEAIPGSKHVHLNDMSHFLHLEEPEPVIQIIKEMIVEVKKSMENEIP